MKQAGHSEHLVCGNLDRRVRVEHNGTSTVHRLAVVPRALGPLHGIATLPYPMNPVWFRAMARVVRDTGADLIPFATSRSWSPLSCSADPVLKGDSGRAAVHGRYNRTHDSKISWTSLRA